MLAAVLRLVHVSVLSVQNYLTVQQLKSTELLSLLPAISVDLGLYTQDQAKTLKL